MSSGQRAAPQGRWGIRKASSIELTEATFDVEVRDLAAFPDLQRLVGGVSESMQVAPGMVLGTVLGAISVATQGLVDTQRPDGCQIPTSLMVLIVAGSGERKSSVEKLLFKPLRLFQQNMRQAYENELREYQAFKKSHDYRIKMLGKERAKHSHESDEFRQIGHDLRESVRHEPTKPRSFKFLYQEASIEALMQGMADDLNCVGLVSSEGSAVLKSRAFSSFATINSLWSGEDVDISRVSTGNRHITGGRLSALIMAQQEALEEFVEAKGETARGVGLWARFLVIRPRSTQGHRLLQGKEGIDLAPVLERYEEKIQLLMQETVDRFKVRGNRDVMELSPEAGRVLIQLYNSIEESIQCGGVYEEAKDHASKLIENILRVAALMSYFEYGAGPVSTVVLKAAARIVGASSACFMDCFAHRSPLAVNAQSLLHWLESRYSGSVFEEITKKDILQKGPYGVRAAKKLDGVLYYLQKKKCITLEKHGLAIRIKPVPGAHLCALDVDGERVRSLFSDL